MSRARIATMRIRLQLQATGGNTTGFEIPDAVVDELGGGRRPAVVASVPGHTWRTSIARYGESSWLGVSAANRAASGLAAGDEVDLGLELDTAPREITVPADLGAALAAAPSAQAAFGELSYSNQRRIVEGIEGAKTAPTRERRVAKAVADLVG
jgi:hypothetical protein